MRVKWGFGGSGRFRVSDESGRCCCCARVQLLLFFYVITSSSVIAAMLDDRRSTERLGLRVELALFSSICPFCVVGGTEFSKVAIRTALGFIVMGFIGFFVKLIFIPINNIIVGSG